MQVALGDSTRHFVVANSDGLFAGDHQVRTRFNVSCIATGDTGMQTGYRPIAGTRGFELLSADAVAEAARGAARQAITKLDARPAPSGDLPVVLAGGSGGILFHEACGHGLEADAILKQASVYAGKVGQLVASPLVTLVDDGTVEGEWGYLAIDDEGRPGRAQRPDRERRADRLHVGLPALAQGGSGLVGQSVVVRATSTCRWCA